MMRSTIRLAAAGVFCLVLAACQESDEPLAPGENTRVEVLSDPDGADIFLNGSNTGKRTPDLLRDLRFGQHQIIARRDYDGVSYAYVATVDVKGDSLHRIQGPLSMRCSPSNPTLPSSACTAQYSKYHTFGTLNISVNPNGALFYSDASPRGMYHPAGIGGQQYASIGMPLISMLAGVRDTLALGLYDLWYLAGRPAPVVTQTGDRYTLRQSFWIVPPPSVIFGSSATVRGIEVEEELIGIAGSDVVFIKLTFRNITKRPSYQAADPIVPKDGLTFNWVYVGFGLDADIGDPNDDFVTYDASQNMVYAYDRDFSEGQFVTEPALIGLKLLSAPAGMQVAMNAWPRGNDWAAGIGNQNTSERIGWGILSGSRSLLPDFEGTQIGHTPTTAGDYRMSVSAGPMTLRPEGESSEVSIVVAVLLAPPVSGKFTPGQVVEPGNPTTKGRQIEEIAGNLLTRAKELVVPQ